MTDTTREEPAPEAALALDEVAFSFEDRTIFDGASLSVMPGEACVLLGDNGAGKSTLIRLVLGELTPRAGSVKVLGTEGTARRDWTCVGYVPQATSSAFTSFPATVREVIGASVTGKRAHAKRRAAELMESLGICDLAGHLLSELSGGQLQRVLLARALANHPQVLLLDEPTSGLDSEAAAEFSRLVAQLAADGCAVLLVTHDTARLPGLMGARVARIEGTKIFEEQWKEHVHA